MDQIRHWWATVLERFLAWLGSVWHVFSYSLLERWDITFFVLGMAVILLLGLIFIWRRGA